VSRPTPLSTPYATATRDFRHRTPRFVTYNRHWLSPMMEHSEVNEEAFKKSEKMTGDGWGRDRWLTMAVTDMEPQSWMMEVDHKSWNHTGIPLTGYGNSVCLVPDFFDFL